MQNLVAVLYHMHTCGVLELHSLGMEIVPDPVETCHACPHKCYLTRFGRSRSNGVGVSWGSRKIYGMLGLRPLGMGCG